MMRCLMNDPLLDMRKGAEAIRARHVDWKPWEDLWWLFDHLPAPPSYASPAKPARPPERANEPDADR
jgi:hypothetical protein